jgi:hypothetical protein
MTALRAALLLSMCSFAAACGPHQAPSLCTGTETAAGCQQTCDPSVGAANTCPAGFHCSPDGMCDQECTPGGTQCGADATCTADGTCEDNGGSPGSNATAPDAGTCADVHFTATQVTPSITLLVDQSGSMADNFSGGTGGESKYAAETDALVGSAGVVTNLQTKAYFGATLYTTSNDNSVCPQLQVTPRALSNLTNIKTLITANHPGNNTPTPQSILAVVADFALNPPPSGSPPIIVLSTDGLPNSCDGSTVETAASVSAAQVAYAAGIKLYMLSVGDQVSDSHAQAMANAGVGAPAGTNAPYYTGNDPASLAAAFQTIIQGQISCDLTISGMIDASQASTGTVTLDGMPLTYGTDWTLTSPTTIELEGAACTTLQTTPNPVVDATFPCGSVVVQ